MSDRYLCVRTWKLAEDLVTIVESLVLVLVMTRMLLCQVDNQLLHNQQ